MSDIGTARRIASYYEQSYPPDVLDPGPAPAPVIASIVPDEMMTTDPPLTLVINGTGFVDGLGVTFSGVPTTPTFISSTRIDIVNFLPLVALGVHPTVVTNPDGQESNVVDITVTQGVEDPEV